jgi:phage protein D
MDGCPGFYASRPVISVDGCAENALGDALLVSLLVEESTAGLFRCEARFGNWGPRDTSAGFLLFDRDLLDFGKEIVVELGPQGNARRVFRGRISGMEGNFPAASAPELTILAEDRFQALRMSRRTRSFEDLDDAAVIRQVAGEHGLSADLDLDGPSHPVLVQLNQSDLAFLRERAASCGAELWLEDTTLKAAASGRRDAGQVELAHGAGLLEFIVLADLAGQQTTLRVAGWDVEGKQAILEEAGEDAVAAELAGGEGGASVLGKAFAARVETVASAAPARTEEARAEAKARYARRARRFLTGSGCADGTAAIQVGTRLRLTGLGPLFSGDYRTTLVRHRFDAEHGYRTEFEVERAGFGGGGT